MRSTHWVGGLIVFAVAAGGSFYGWRSLTAPPAQAAAPNLPVVVVSKPLVQSVVDYDEFTGRFEPTATVEIRPRVSGYLTQINFTDGQQVEAGQVLFVIDRRPYQSALSQAKAQLSGARAQLTFAENDEKRSQELVKTSNIPVAVHEQRIQAREAAQAALEAAEAAVERAALNLDFTEVRSPIRGRVSNRRVDLGNLVVGDGSSTVLTNVVAQDELYFVFDISEGDLLARRRAPGAAAEEADDLPVEARQDGETTWTRKGKLDFIDNRLQAGSGTIRARATFANPDRSLTPGQFGRIRLPRGEAYAATLIPEAAIAVDQYNRIALTLDDKDVVRQRTVDLGPAQPGGLVVVRSGVSPDDRVVINGLMQAKPGQTVRPEAGTIAPPAAPQS